MRRRNHSISVNYLSFVDFFMGAIGVLVFITLLMAVIAPQIEENISGKEYNLAVIEAGDQIIYSFYFHDRYIEIRKQDSAIGNFVTYNNYFSDILEYMNNLSVQNETGLKTQKEEVNRVLFVVYPSGAQQYNNFEAEMENFSFNFAWGLILLNEGEEYSVYE